MSVMGEKKFLVGFVTGVPSLQLMEMCTFTIVTPFGFSLAREYHFPYLHITVSK